MTLPGRLLAWPAPASLMAVASARAVRRGSSSIAGHLTRRATADGAAYGAHLPSRRSARKLCRDDHPGPHLRRALGRARDLGELRPLRGREPGPRALSRGAGRHPAERRLGHAAGPAGGPARRAWLDAVRARRALRRSAPAGTGHRGRRVRAGRLRLPHPARHLRRRRHHPGPAGDGRRGVRGLRRAGQLRRHGQGDDEGRLRRRLSAPGRVPGAARLLPTGWSRRSLPSRRASSTRSSSSRPTWAPASA